MLYVLHDKYTKIDIKTTWREKIPSSSRLVWKLASPNQYVVRADVWEKRAWMGGSSIRYSIKNIDINSVFGKYKVNTIKYDISKYLFDKMWNQQMFIR